ncbi:MAG: N-acetylmuramoyl-L-alanine amidase [Lachnospiraceae bacterium]|nr:N-acetylmuramoyl-L-alanine amidase [Lachnospiraceae bacterium]
MIIVIDPGHGGENNGTEECGFLEKEMTLKTAKTMAAELEKFEGVKVYLTREDDKELSLKERAKIAEKYHADYLISLHYNASESHKLFGSEVWVSLIPEYHNPGYQLGTMFLREFRDMGLTLRGIKTKRHSKGNDYYGILRESVNLKIPAIIVEHCHVDHAADNSYCDSDEELEEFGLADARAVAKYLGLKSDALGIDYSDEVNTLPEVTAGKLVPRAAQDQTIPEYCNIKLKEAKYEEDLVTIEVTASDPESNLIYYSYSFDGGVHFCDSIPWPEGDILTGEFTGKFEVEIEVPDNTSPQLVFRATNPYDLNNDSNVITFDQVFHKPEPTPEPEPSFVDATAKLLGEE